METELAKFILQMISRSTMPADDQTQSNIAAAKGWLKAIASGALVVKPAKAPK